MPRTPLLSASKVFWLNIFHLNHVGTLYLQSVRNWKLPGIQLLVFRLSNAPRYTFHPTDMLFVYWGFRARRRRGHFAPITNVLGKIHPMHLSRCVNDIMFTITNDNISYFVCITIVCDNNYLYPFTTPVIATRPGIRVIVQN